MELREKVKRFFQTHFVHCAALSVNILSFGTGFGYAWSSTAIPKLNGQDQPEFNPLPRPTTIFEDSWITSLLSLGAAIGPVAAGYSSSRIGRKNTMLLFSLPMLISNIMIIFASTVMEFYIARFLVGLTIGSGFVVIPVYTSEISEKHQRGSLGILFAMTLTTGSLILHVTGVFATIRTLAIMAIIPNVVFLIVFGLFIPESPYYYILINKPKEAEESLMQLRNKSEVQKELLEIIKTVEDTKNIESSGISDFFKNKYAFRALIYSIGLMFFQQFTGVLAVTSYLQTIFDSTGSSIPGYLSVIMVDIIQVATVFITTIFIDRIKRRVLLITSLAGILVSLVSLSVFFQLQQEEFNISAIYWLPTASVMLYIVFINFGIGPLVWTFAGEIFDPKIKSLGTTIAACFSIGLGFVLSVIFPSMIAYLGTAGPLWIFSGVSAIGIVYITIAIPETKGKTFMEIQDMLKKT